MQSAINCHYKETVFNSAWSIKKWKLFRDKYFDWQFWCRKNERESDFVCKKRMWLLQRKLQKLTHIQWFYVWSCNGITQTTAPSNHTMWILKIENQCEKRRTKDIDTSKRITKFEGKKQNSSALFICFLSFRSRHSD